METEDLRAPPKDMRAAFAKSLDRMEAKVLLKRAVYELRQGVVNQEKKKSLGYLWYMFYACPKKAVPVNSTVCQMQQYDNCFKWIPS